jgi:hypothetical protein
MEGETVSLWGVLAAVGIGALLAVLIAFAINTWKRRG